MFTRHLNSLTRPRALVVLLAAVFVGNPAMQAQANSPILNHSPNSIYSAMNFGGDLPERIGIQPQLQTASAVSYGYSPGFSSLDPETQGDLLMVHQQYVSAVNAYRRAPQDSAIVWNKLGIAYQHLYAMDFAKLQYEKALSIDPQYAEAINNLGTIYYGQKSYKKAERCYRKAIRIKPETASFYSNLGTAYFADQKYKQGLQAYQKAFVLDPQVFIRESLERIAEMGPVEEQRRLNYALAKIYAQAGNLEAALVYLRAALSEGFDDRKKIMSDKELATLRGTPEFHLLMAEEHIATNTGAPAQQ
jgi:tetratricopeptide (TPR) repeat protein